MKVIFLDLDGVLNDIHYQGELVNPLFVRALKKLIDETNAKVVITSERREDALVNKSGSLENSFCYNNFIKPLLQMGVEVYDYTAFVKAKQEERRELEIEEYLIKHPEINEYVIIEDDYVMKRLYEHQIFIDSSDGFTDVYLEPAIQILNGHLGFYPPWYDRSETFQERLKRLFPSLFLNSTLEEIMNSEETEDGPKLL